MCLAGRLLIVVTVLLTQICRADWELVKADENNQIRVYTRVTEHSALREFRGELHLQSTLSALVALIEDNKAGPQWIHQCRALEIIEQLSEHERLSYMVTDAPWPVTDRDSVIYSALSQDAVTRRVRIALQARNNVFAVDDAFVRITAMQGFWEFWPEDNGWIRVVYQVHADPAGDIPAWLANSVVVDAPYHTLKNMRKMVGRKPYVNARLSYIRDASHAHSAQSAR